MLKKTKEKKEEPSKESSGKGSREDSGKKKMKLDEKPKDNAGDGREGKKDEDDEESPSKCTVEELESWKDEVNIIQGAFFNWCF